MEKYKIGYTAGVFDMFHVGHLNLLRAAKERCCKLIVGVNSDELVCSYKGKLPMIPFKERLEIVRGIRYVDEAVKRDTLDKVDAWKENPFDIVFIGDDWKGSERWNNTELALAKFGVKVGYIHYTVGISSSDIRKRLIESEMLQGDLK